MPMWSSDLFELLRIQYIPPNAEGITIQFSIILWYIYIYHQLKSVWFVWWIRSTTIAAVCANVRQLIYKEVLYEEETITYSQCGAGNFLLDPSNRHLICRTWSAAVIAVLCVILWYITARYNGTHCTRLGQIYDACCHIQVDIDSC